MTDFTLVIRGLLDAIWVVQDTPTHNVPDDSDWGKINAFNWTLKLLEHSGHMRPPIVKKTQKNTHTNKRKNPRPLHQHSVSGFNITNSAQGIFG